MTNRPQYPWLILAALILLCSGCSLTATAQTPNAPPGPPAKVHSLKSSKNSFGMTFVRIPAGSFLMGSPEDEIGRDKGERSHPVTLSHDYYLQTTEVTQGQWQAITGENPTFFRNCGTLCPIENISWSDAQNFIEKLNQADPDNSYRLPTEAEWEYAARAGAETALANGNLLSNDLFTDNNLNQIGWHVGNSEAATHPVALKQSNTWGLYDMHGNVREWCSDWYHVYPFNSVTDPAGPASGWSKVRRGGSWNLYTHHHRSASRDWTIITTRDPFTGLRLVQIDKPPQPPQPVVEAPRPTIPEQPKSWVLQFEYDKAEIIPPMQVKLKEILTVSKPDDLLLIEGYTCDLGSTAYNLLLSKRRAEAIQNYLIKHGFAATRIHIEFFGEEEPAYPNISEQERSNNRRVTVRIKPTT